MGKIITNINAFGCTETYFCLSCHRIYRLSIVKSAEKQGKCDRCGGRLIKAELYKH